MTGIFFARRNCNTLIHPCILSCLAAASGGQEEQQRSEYPTTTTPSTATTNGNGNEKLPPAPITRKSTLLLDDDHRNIRHALDNGVRAIWFDPKRPNKLLPEIMKLV